MLNSGDVEFRPHAVSNAAADTGPWLLRTGFRLLGRTTQLRFYREMWQRARRLTEYALEARRVAACQALAAGDVLAIPAPVCAV